jgi:hypothetical protein
MAFELIRRKEGEATEKQEIRHSNVQISINDWGHLVIREFDKPRISGDCEIGRENCAKEALVCCDYESGFQCEHYKTTRADDEHLLVFDRATTERLINFIFSIRSTHELKQILRALIEKQGGEMPF